jgi:hypothetical protein
MAQPRGRNRQPAFIYLNEPHHVAIIRDTLVHFPAQIGDTWGRNRLSTARSVA